MKHLIIQKSASYILKLCSFNSAVKQGEQSIISNLLLGEILGREVQIDSVKIMQLKTLGIKFPSASYR